MRPDARDWGYHLIHVASPHSPMRRHVEAHFGFLRTTVLGGIVFLLPITVVGWLIGQGAYAVYSAVGPYLLGHPREAELFASLRWTTYLMFAGAALALLTGICFVAGMIARRSIGQWSADRAERYLMMLFPRYAVFKDQLTGNLGIGSLRPVRVVAGGMTRVGMEVERNAAGVVTVYLPGTPDPWSGVIALFAPEEVTPIDREPIDVMTNYEQLGRGVSEKVTLE